MHGLSPFQLAGLKGISEHDPRQGFRNLFDRMRGVQIEFFKGHDLADQPDADDQIRRLLRSLSARIERGRNRLWEDRIEPPPLPGTPARPPGEAWENPAIPSGYTYLLQLVAHDLIASSVSLSVNGARAVVENTRGKALLLETVYGGGPDACPHVFELSPRNRESKGFVPRIRMRVGPKRQSPAEGMQCPMRDVARGTADGADNPGLDTPERKSWKTEAMLVDPRNDVHALMSQTTVLFHSLHNAIIDKLEKRRSPAPSEIETAYRRFLCARLVVALIYRQIIRLDLMRRILHEDVFKAYSNGFLLDKVGEDIAPAIPFEFSHGAFRFGHAMIRDAYRVNSMEDRSAVFALRQSSVRSPAFVPVTGEWLVDWRRFYEIDPAITPNYSHRIGPDYPSVLNGTNFPAPGDAEGLSVAFRDGMASCYAGVWSVPELIAKIKELAVGEELADNMPAYAVWKEPLRRWLAELPASPWQPHPLSNDDAKRIVEDPPLAFFVLFEAAHTLERGEPVRTKGGCKLGHLGSILIAETIFGALERDEISIVKQLVSEFRREPTLKERIRACCKRLLEDEQALDDVQVPDGAKFRDIASMPDLIRFLADCHAFPGGQP